MSVRIAGSPARLESGTDLTEVRSIDAWANLFYQATLKYSVYEKKWHNEKKSNRKQSIQKRQEFLPQAFYIFFVGKRERNIIDLRLLKLKIQAYPTHILYLLLNGKNLF
jgi:hypothetical protein